MCFSVLFGLINIQFKYWDTAGQHFLCASKVSLFCLVHICSRHHLINGSRIFHTIFQASQVATGYGVWVQIVYWHRVISSMVTWWHASKAIGRLCRDCMEIMQCQCNGSVVCADSAWKLYGACAGFVQRLPRDGQWLSKGCTIVLKAYNHHTIFSPKWPSKILRFCKISVWLPHNAGMKDLSTGYRVTIYSNLTKVLIKQNCRGNGPHETVWKLYCPMLPHQGSMIVGLATGRTWVP